jgi:hypothetical protein
MASTTGHKVVPSFSLGGQGLEVDRASVYRFQAIL